MSRAPEIKTKAPGKGDLVVGHKVYAFMRGGLPAIPGEIVEATDAAVTMKVDPFVVVMTGCKKHVRWTWRRSVGAYQEAGTRTRKGVGLGFVTNP